MNNRFYDRRLWLFFWISEPFLDMSICHAHSYQYILTCTGLSLNFSILKTNSFTTYFNWPKVYSVIFYTMEQNFLHKVDFNIVHYNGFAKSWTTINLILLHYRYPWDGLRSRHFLRWRCACADQSMLIGGTRKLWMWQIAQRIITWRIWSKIYILC